MGIRERAKEEMVFEMGGGMGVVGFRQKNSWTSSAMEACSLQGGKKEGKSLSVNMGRGGGGFLLRGGHEGTRGAAGKQEDTQVRRPGGEFSSLYLPVPIPAGMAELWLCP